MQPQDLVRSAAEIIKTRGWCRGEPGTARAVNARGSDGEPVDLILASSEGTSRASVNPHAWSFSIYGALVKAQAIAGVPVENQRLMWDTLHRMASAATGAAHGGTNYVHPILQYNETEGRTKEEVLAFLDAVATELEPQVIRTVEERLKEGTKIVEWSPVDPAEPPRVIGQTGFPPSAAPDPAPSPSMHGAADSRLPPISWEPK